MEQHLTESGALEKAALIIKHLKVKLEDAEKWKTKPVAVVGMSCRFPGEMNSVEQYWKGLLSGIDTISLLPVNRWDQKNSNQKLYGSFLNDIESFDASFFGISPREAKAMDPQQRLLMESSWLAFEDAGIKSELLKGTKTGVFVGAMSHDYSEWSYGEDSIGVYTGTGTANSIMAGRLSYYYDLNGPAMTIDTACSSSLVAIHQAVMSLRNGETDLCIALGVNAILSPSIYNIEIANQMLSPDGICKTFDSAANGFARGEGVGAVVLKRLDDAIRDNDRIYCIVSGSVLNHDGKGAGMMAPNQSAQEQLLAEAMAQAGLTPDDLGFIECHGTGTVLGDPVEVGAIVNIFGKSRKKPLYLGAVKSNMGHLEGAAGIAGFIKMALSIFYSAIPPNIHFNKLNRYIELNKYVYIADSLVGWPDEIRSGGVSSFGFSGTNAHQILQSFKQSEKREEIVSIIPVAFSAASPKALEEYLRIFEWDKKNINQLYTLNCRRVHFQFRKLYFNTDPWMPGKIKSILPEYYRAKPKIVFLFSGQGSQYKDMGLLLYKNHPVFKKCLDECNKYYKTITGNELLDYIYGNKSELINNTYITQPAIFSVSYASACTWKSHGIEPSAICGHSIGEWAAACFSGMISLKDAMMLVVQRGKLMQAAKPGLMYAIRSGYEYILPFLTGLDVAIAAINSKDQVVISGNKEQVSELVKKFESYGIRCSQLNVKHAFHSGMMKEAAESFAEFVNGITFNKSNYIIYNNIDGIPLTHEKILSGYWQQQITSPVNYNLCAGYLPEDAIFIETGPGNTLLQLTSGILKNSFELHPGLSTITDASAFYNSFKVLFEKGLNLYFESFFQNKYFTESLPPYSFDRIQYWINNDFKINLKKSKNINEELLPDLYKRKWVSIKNKQTQSVQSDIVFKYFLVSEPIEKANQELLHFAHLLNEWIQSGLHNIIIIADLNNVISNYRYPLGMALLACLQSVMLEKQGIFSGIILNLNHTGYDCSALKYHFNTPNILLLKDGDILELKWYKAGNTGTGLSISSENSYIIYGGSGYIGLSIAKYIINNNGGHVIMVGRRTSDELSSDHIEFIAESNKKGIKVEYKKISHIETGLRGLIKNGSRQIGGIFNAAGSYNNTPISGLSYENTYQVLLTKIFHTLELIEFCKKYEVEFLLNCSSAVAMTGAPMLGHYAFANAFMDAISEQEKDLKIYSVGWGGWKNSTMLNSGTNEEFQKQWGFNAVSSINMLKTFNFLEAGYTAVLNINWDKYFSTAFTAKVFQPFSVFVDNNKLNQIAISSPGKSILNVKDLNKTVYNIVAKILESSIERIDFSLPFDEIGFNSLLALELSNSINESFSINLPSTVVYEYTTPELLVNYLAQLIFPKKEIANKEYESNQQANLTLEELDNISFEDIKSLLAKKINY